MTPIVHWKEIVLRYFVDEALFEKITRAILFCHRTDTPASKAFDKLDLEKQEKYDLTRWHMRIHGWYSGYVEQDNLKFLCLVEAQDRKYITIPQYLDSRQNEGLDEMIDEYYNTRPVVQSVVQNINKPKPRKDLDGDDEGGYLV